MALVRMTNFASRSAPPLVALAAALWLTATLSAGATVWIALDIRALRSEAGALARHAERLQADIDAQAARAGGAPGASEIDHQAERIAFYNELSGPRGRPAVALLAQLEETVPAQARLSRLAYDIEQGRLSVSVQAEEEAILPVVLEKLEADPGYSSVILERQLRLQQGGLNLLQFDITAVVR